MPQIIPIKDLKDTAKVSEPIFVTKNGYGDMVLMSMEAFEEMHQKEQLYRELEISENDIRGGKIRAAREALSDVRKNYGI